MAELSCYIWNTPAAEIRDSDGDSVYINSPRAGGPYSVTGTALEAIKKLSNQERTLLTTWLCKQRSAGVECPKITSDIVSNVKSLQPLSTTERIERALLYFNKRVRIGENIHIYPGEFTKADPDASVLAALTRVQTKPELEALMGLLVDAGLLIDPVRVLARSTYTPTSRG